MPFSAIAIRHLVSMSDVEWVGEPSWGETALLHRFPHGGLNTWISDGPVTISTAQLTSAPADAELADWDDVIQASALLGERAAAHGMEEHPTQEGHLASRAGIHGVLIAARGRLEAYDAAASDSDEQYLIATWPIVEVADGRTWWLHSKRARQHGLDPTTGPAKNAAIARSSHASQTPPQLVACDLGTGSPINPTPTLSVARERPRDEQAASHRGGPSTTPGVP